MAMLEENAVEPEQFKSVGDQVAVVVPADALEATDALGGGPG